MGLSSSQARLLTLTSRMHDIEYKAAKLEAQKLQMANESRKAYEDYLVALDATKIQLKTIDTDGSIKNIDATYQNLINAGYEITFKDYGYGLDHDIYENFVRATHDKTQFGYNNREYFAALQTGKTVPAEGILSKGTDGVYEIYTSKQLASVLSSDISNKNIRFMSSFDVSDIDYNSINIANCNIDGNGHSITGLNKALFNSVSGNSNISNLSLSGNSSSRALLANSVSTTGTISNVHVSGTVSNNDSIYIGGLIGLITKGTVQYCTSSANVSNKLGAVGGLIGSVNGTNPSDVKISNCSSSGNVSTEFTYVGGFIGRVTNADIDHCTSSGSVSTSYIIQYDPNPENGKVYGSPSFYGLQADIGGFIGILAGSTTTATESNIQNCSTTSNVYAAGDTAGGFVGHIWAEEESEVKNCSSSGTVYYNCAADDPVKRTILEDWRDNNCQSSETNGGFVANIQGGQITNCNSTSILVNKWNDTVGNDSAGEFCGITHTDKGPNVFSNNYATNTSADFIGSYNPTHAYNANVESTSISSPNIFDSTPASAPSYTQVKIDGPGAEQWRVIFDNAVAKGGTEVFDLSDADPYGLNEHKNDTQWLTNLINEGYAYLYKVDTKNNTTYQVSVATDTGLQEVSDEKDLRKAEAKYEADMKKIDLKDRRYDTQLAALDNERNAIKSEMETLKTVAKDNVERTFKLFS